jgi:hypothetical protein
MKFYLFGLFFMLVGQICPFTPGGDDGTSTSGGEIDTSYFTEMALGAACSDRRNEMYLVDKTMVIWYVAGRCADASYHTTLFDAQTHATLCSAYDSIAGPRVSCTDESYLPIFEELTGGEKGGRSGDHILEPITIPGLPAPSGGIK